MKPGPRFAFVCYAVLALLAGLTLEDPLRAATWILLAGLALKTWLAYVRDRGA